MTVYSFKPLRESIKMSGRINMKPLVSATSIDLLMIWLLKLSNLREDLYGLVRTPMVMSNPISSLKVSDLLVS